jgi:hypothetical protein
MVRSVRQSNLGVFTLGGIVTSTTAFTGSAVNISLQKRGDAACRNGEFSMNRMWYPGNKIEGGPQGRN